MAANGCLTSETATLGLRFPRFESSFRVALFIRHKADFLVSSEDTESSKVERRCPLCQLLWSLSHAHLCRWHHPHPSLEAGLCRWTSPSTSTLPSATWVDVRAHRLPPSGPGSPSSLAWTLLRGFLGFHHCFPCTQSSLQPEGTFKCALSPALPKAFS